MPRRTVMPLAFVMGPFRRRRCSRDDFRFNVAGECFSFAADASRRFLDALFSAASAARRQ